MLRELARSYLTIVKDLSRVMNRLKAVYRSWAIPCAGRDVYYTRHRVEWLGKIKEAGVRRRAERLYQQLDMLQYLRQQARRDLLAESRKHAITIKLRQIPSLGPIRSALAVALIQTPIIIPIYVDQAVVGMVSSNFQWIKPEIFQDQTGRNWQFPNSEVNGCRMLTGMRSAELKARWAKEHLEALQARIRLWVKEEASHPITKDDVERGHHDLDKNKLERVKDATESRSVAGERRSLP
jgi:hypothetical protein